MIRDFSEYITQYMTESGLRHRPSPGEHHFVSIYLIPRLYLINKRVPDYVNPDGTKKVIGDVVYYKDHEHQLGIEVKLGTVRLTKNEFNTWIVNSDEVEWPHTFLGVGKRGLIISSWKHFREAYVKAVKHKLKDWTPQLIEKGYGPSKNVDELFNFFDPQFTFERQQDAQMALHNEYNFLKALRSEIDC